MAGSLNLLIPVVWPEGIDLAASPVSYALTSDAEPGPDDWREASWEGYFMRMAGPRPTPGQYTIWTRTSVGVRHAGLLNVTDRPT